MSCDCSGPRTFLEGWCFSRLCSGTESCNYGVVPGDFKRERNDYRNRSLAYREDSPSEFTLTGHLVLPERTDDVSDCTGRGYHHVEFLGGNDDGPRGYRGEVPWTL